VTRISKKEIIHRGEPPQRTALRTTRSLERLFDLGVSQKLGNSFSQSPNRQSLILLVTVEYQQ
jgi:hypothetical protein